MSGGRIVKGVREYCGVFGVFGHPEASGLTTLGLYALQHRGQEGAGIVSSDGEVLYSHLGEGLVNDVFSSRSMIQDLKGHMAIGHNRYSTTGSSKKMNVQPILANCKSGPLALGHNGNLVNSVSLRDMLQDEGALFQTSTDSELIVHLIARSRKKDLQSRVLDALKQVSGAYSLVILTPEGLIAARDPFGFRPLCLGKLHDTVMVASETCALDLVGAQYERDITPGEVLTIDSRGLHSAFLGSAEPSAHCIFELIYFSRPDSRIFGDNVDKTRRKFGKALALEHPADADIVIAVPDSSNTAALGYARQSDLPFELGLIRNHYIGRTFIQPHQSIRHFNVKVKFNPIAGVLHGKRIVVVEDSIVRGNTLKVLTRLIRQAGAAEVHIRVSSPPIRYPCFYGMDFPTREELIASSKTVEEIRTYLGVDSLGYLSLERLVQAAPQDGRGYCTACFSGQYPVPIEETSKEAYDSGFKVMQ